MIIKQCPICGKKPTIIFHGFTKNHLHIHSIERPDHCNVLKTDQGTIVNSLTYIESLDKTHLYKMWNERIIDSTIPPMIRQDYWM